MAGQVIQERALFQIADYAIFGLVLFISSSIGVYFAIAGEGQKTTSEYLVGNRKMKFGPVALSVIVSFQSSILMLGFPAEVYSYGTQFWMANIGITIGIIFIAQVIVPLIHPLGLTSTYEYLGRRYNSQAPRLLGSVFGILYQIFYMGIVLFGNATALEAVTGFSAGYSIILVTVASMFYTALVLRLSTWNALLYGQRYGIRMSDMTLIFKAVIWTDTLQFILMVGGMVPVIIMGTMYVGGVERMWQLNVDGGRVKFFEFDPSPFARHTFWTLVAANAIQNTSLGFNQLMVQRVVSIETLSKAKLIVILVVPGFVLVGTLASLEGMVSYAYFSHTECDPFGAKIISNPNQVLPFLVMELFRNLPGLPGMFLASLFSASLSTLSSCLSSISALVWTDFLKPHMRNVSEIKATIAAKIVVVLFGAMAIAFAYMIMSIGGTLQQVSYVILSSIAGPLTGMFFAGCFFSVTNSVGAITGAVISFVLSFWMSMGKSFSPYTLKTPYLPPAPTQNCYVNGTYNFTDMTTSASVAGNSTTSDVSGLTALYSMSYLLTGPIGMISCVVVALFVSVLTGGCKTAQNVDPKYIVHLWDSVCCCLPDSCRGKFGYKGHRRQKYEKRNDSGSMDDQNEVSVNLVSLKEC